MLSAGGAARPSIRSWMESNPEAAAFVEEWLKMRGTIDEETGLPESSWGVEAVRSYLETEYGFPYSSEAMFGKYLKRAWPELYESGVARDS